MSGVAASILPICAAFVCFAAIIVVRRMIRGYPAFQQGDSARVIDVLVHASPMLAGCMVYNHAVSTKADIWLELLAALLLVAALGVAVYRVMQRLDVEKKR
jgi:TRAP-type C4-dicarboxylate transport system permease small subunit